MRRYTPNPAVTFLRHVPELQPWVDGWAAAGKTKLAIVGAAMHKLIRMGIIMDKIEIKLAGGLFWIPGRGGGSGYDAAGSNANLSVG